MPITKAEAQAVTLAFTRDYPGALALIYHFRESTNELYGDRAGGVPADLKGGYLSKEHIYQGRAYRGRVDVPLGNVDDVADLLVTLRHEVLGHYGANTFAPAEKRALLDGIIAAREQPGMKDRWEDINRRYVGSSTDVRAEEVWALHCETFSPSQHVSLSGVRERGERSFVETCIARVRPMQVADLHNIVCMVADGLHDLSRRQQTFPTINEVFRQRGTMELKKPFHEVVAEKLIEQLKAGTAPWQKPWRSGASNSLMPINPATGKRYKGINAIHLMAESRADSRWMTYKQAIAVGAQVRKGEKGTPVQYWKFSEEQDRLDEQGRPVRDANGEKVKETIQLERPRVFFATVFNAEQIDGLAPQQITPQSEPQWDALARAEQMLKASGAHLTHVDGDRAFYRPATDRITLPEKSQFESADRYYATALHELGHWTGHPSRLDRDLAHPFGSQGYAKEELRAEIASMILGDELGIGHDPGQHAAYVGSWIKVLQDEPLEMFRAAADAEKIRDYVLAFEQKQVQDQNQEQNLTQSRAQRPPHELTLAQFAKQASAQELVNHGRKWEVRHGNHVAFSDADTAEQAVADVHHGAVNNALYSNTPEARQMNLPASSFPSPTILADYPDLIEKFPDAIPAPEINSVRQGERAVSESHQNAERQYINVPFKEKDEAKQLGARWDRQEQSWYVPAGIDRARFAKWTQAEGAAPVIEAKQETKQTRQYLAVPYAQRNAAKAAGALWDKAAKSWYVGPSADITKLQPWRLDSVQAQQAPAMTPREEFAEAMRSIGLFTGSNAQGDHPIMDGKRHRVPVEGGKKGALDGFYIGHMDSHPAGRIINNKTGEDITWKSKGYTLSDQDKARFQSEAADKRVQREIEHAQVQQASAQRVARQMAELVPIDQPTPYMTSKGVTVHVGVFTDNEGQKTCIPAFDVEGTQWTMQYIQEDGTKRFAKDSKKEGCFHPVGGMDALACAPVLVIAEGYATAASLAEGLGHATVAAFDSGNLPHVARVLHDKYPNKAIVIAGDDDKAQELARGYNPGRVKAEEAAKAVGGKAVYPIFAPGEQAGNPKGFSDFNDLANKSELGREGLRRQVSAVVSKVLGEMSHQEKKQKLVQAPKHEQVARPRRVARIG